MLWFLKAVNNSYVTVLDFSLVMSPVRKLVVHLYPVSIPLKMSVAALSVMVSTLLEKEYLITLEYKLNVVA